MERLLRPENSSQESQVSLLPAADLRNSRVPLGHGRGVPLEDTCEQLELNHVSLKPQGERGPSASSQYLPGYAASIHRRMTWWSWHSAWSMYAFLLLGIAFATGHHFYYTSLHRQPAREQTQRLRYGTFLAFLTKACLIWAVVAAFRQRIWATLRSKSLPPQGVDSLFAIVDDPLAALDWRTTMNGKIAVSMATIVWLGPVMVILASQALSVEPTIDETQCPGIRTLNFLHEGRENWRNATRFDNGLFGYSVSLWNTTLPNITSPEWFDYYTRPSDPIRDIASMALIQQRAIYSSGVSNTTCGPEFDCRYNISFVGPGYKCKPVKTLPSQDDNSTQTAAPPFNESILIPRGNYSYYVHATGGEYSVAQMVNVSTGGIPLDGPPFPQHLGAFRTEPVVWVGHSTITGSGPLPQTRAFPGWNDYYTAQVYRCNMFETRYTVDFDQFQGRQSTRVRARDYLKPLINTTYIPERDANDGTNDKTIAVPQNQYVYPNQDKEHYRYVAAFHSIGLVFRNFINGTINSYNVSSPSPDNKVMSSKIYGTRNNTLPPPDVVSSIQSMFEDILLSMLSNHQLLVVSFAGSSSRIAGDQEGDETTLYPCIRSKLENRFRYQSLELGAVYGVSVILAAAAVAVGTVSVMQNGGVLKNTRFSSIATLLQHCGYSLDDYRQPTSRGDTSGGN